MTNPKKILTHLNNERGLTMSELIIGAFIGVIVLGVTVIIFTNQQKVLQDENDKTHIRAKGRHAVKQIAKEVRMAGFGLPATEGITAMGTNSISFRSNLDGVRTTTPPCSGCAGTVAASSGDANIIVVDGSGFSGGDKVVFHDPGFDKSETNTVSGSAAFSIALTSGLTNDYVYGANTNLVTINKYNDITIALSGTDITKTVDGVTSTLISDVAATNGLEFDFYGASTTTAVRKVGITVNLEDPDNSKAVIDFKTDVILRNTAG